METDKCVNYDLSREQRKHEMERGLGKSGTLGYEYRGCYECDGHKNTCNSYYTMKKIMEKEKK